MTDIKQYEPLWGSWYIDEQLGEGSYGKVYKVHKEEFGKIYTAAVKIISIPQNESDILQAKSEGLNDESARSYFQAFVTDIIQEVDLMNAFHGNSNIVSLEEHKVMEKKGEIGWDILIRMELLETLPNYITHNSMTQAEIIKLGVHICRALELCARHNTIHRDIKPDNIFVSQYGDYKLGDFGIARQVERTMSGLSKKGTYQYMAPEVFKGSPYGASVDTYSLGIVMYRFLNKNRAPFMPEYPNPITPRDRDESLQRRMSGEALPKINGINEELNSIVLKACEYNREERFKSASEMKNALEAVKKNDPSLNVPIIEISDSNSDNRDENGSTESFSEMSMSVYNDESTSEKTQIVFSRKIIDEPENEDLSQNEPEIKVPDSVTNKLAIFSAILCGLLAVLTFFSTRTSDIFTFLPLYGLCISQCIMKFESKILNYSFMIYLACYLLFSMLIDFRLFDYGFLIFALCLLSIIASREKKFQIICCVSMIICTVIISVLVLHISKRTHYNYVAGAAAIPFLTLINSPVALLLGRKSLSNKIGFFLLALMQIFTIIVMIIYAIDLTGYSELLNLILCANFPGLSPERFSWWLQWRFTGILIQAATFISLLMLAAAKIIPEKFLNMCGKNK